jgi:hypothetical protein
MCSGYNDSTIYVALPKEESLIKDNVPLIRRDITDYLLQTTWYCKKGYSMLLKTQRGIP